MKGDEFAAKLYAGERDFRRIKLEKGYDLSAHENYGGLRTFLINSSDDLKENPVKLVGADLSYLTAPELNLPYTKASKAILVHTVFHGSTFDDADFNEAQFDDANLQKIYFRSASLEYTNLFSANLTGAILTRANLGYANLSRAQLYQASLGHANLCGTNFERTDLSEANLESAKNLDQAKLSKAHFLNTKISRKDRAVVKQALNSQKPLVYDGLFGSSE